MRPWAGILAAGIMGISATMAMNGPAKADESYPFTPDYPFDTAIIQYEGTGIFGGTSTLYIDADKQLKAHEKHIDATIMGMQQRSSTLLLTTPSTIYSIDTISKTGTTMPNPVKALKEKWAAFTPEQKANVRQNIETFGFQMATNLGSDVKQDGGEVLGIKCDVVRAMGTSSCTWSDIGITLKSESTLGIPGKEVATSIQRDVPLPDDIFTIPKGLQLTENPQADMATGMAIAMLESMASPDYAVKMQQTASVTPLVPEAGLEPAAGGDIIQKRDLQQMMLEAQEMMKKMNIE